MVVEDEYDSPTKMGRGIRQGDLLSPDLFNMAMDLILASLPKDVGYRLELEGISQALAYADDLELLAGWKAWMQESIHLVSEVVESMGLRVNQTKAPSCRLLQKGSVRRSAI